MRKPIKIPVGTKVRVLDTPNVRRFNDDAIGYEFITHYPLKEGGVICCPDNKYNVNYVEGDLYIIPGETVINQYPIY